MGEFAKALRRQAAQVLRTMFQHDPGRGADPMLELIGFLLEDGAGGVMSPADTPVTTVIRQHPLCADTVEKLGH